MLPDIQHLAEFVIPFFINALRARGVEPHLQERHERLRDVIFQLAIRFEVNR